MTVLDPIIDAIGVEPYFRDDAVVIYHGDCRDILPLMNPADVGLVLTDPPYGLNYASSYGASWQDSAIEGDEDTWVRDWVVEWAYPVADMYVFGSWKRPRPPECRAVLIWDKGPAFGMGDLSFPWKNSFEEIYVLGDEFVGRRDEAVSRGHIQVSWESEGRCHPNQKPVTLIRYLLSKTKAQTILDPFMGSGTTLRAAKDLGRYAIGIEIEEKYCEIAKRRMAQTVMAL